jgi:hypothetical protein
VKWVRRPFPAREDAPNLLLHPGPNLRSRVERLVTAPWLRDEVPAILVGDGAPCPLPASADDRPPDLDRRALAAALFAWTRWAVVSPRTSRVLLRAGRALGQASPENVLRRAAELPQAG